MYLLHKGMYIAIKRMVYTSIVILLYTSVYNLSYPGVTNMGNADVALTSVLSQSTRPYILANIVMGMLSLMFDYVEKLKNNKDTRSTYDLINICVMMFFSIAYSVISVGYFEPYVINELKELFFIHYSIINLTACLFVAWFNRQMILNGIGQGVSIIISLQILHSFALKMQLVGFFDIIKIMTLKDLGFFYCMFVALVAIEKFVVRIPLFALVSYGYKYKENVVRGYVEYKSTSTNVISNILALQTISLISVFMSWMSNLDIIATLNSFTISNTLNNLVLNANSFSSVTNASSALLQYVFYALLLFAYNYIYTNVYHNSTKTADNMRKQICYIPDVKIGKRTDELVDNVAIVNSLIAVGVTVVIGILPIPVSYYFGCRDLLGGISMLIISSSFMYLIEFTKSIYAYNTYVFKSDSLIDKKNK